jgi:signal peptidase II
VSRELRLIQFLLVISMVLLATTGVRWWVERSLIVGTPVPVVGEIVRLTRGENSGIAFSLLENSPFVPWLSALALMVTVYYLSRPLQSYRLGNLMLGLVMGGGLANLLDRMDDSSVTDYIDVGIGTWRFATFNLPDTAVVIGVTLSFWFLSRTKPVEPLVPSPMPTTEIELEVYDV